MSKFEDSLPVPERLFAVYLGGYAPNCNIELHDMVFVVGKAFEETIPQLIKKWFIKSYHQFHYDGYKDLSVVDGHRVTPQQHASKIDSKLYYVHLGAYDPEELTELHKNCFLIAPDEMTAKSRARQSWQNVEAPHKDMQLNIESCLQIDKIDNWHLHIEPTLDKPHTEYHLGYNIISKELIAQYSE